MHIWIRFVVPAHTIIRPIHNHDWVGPIERRVINVNCDGQTVAVSVRRLRLLAGAPSPTHTNNVTT